MTKKKQIEIYQSDNESAGMNPDTYKFYKNLTWNDLTDWFEDRIVDRGQKYQQQGRVSDLSLTKSGNLIAWVEGTKRYATTVEITEGELLDSWCTCPYTADCKHGVAVILEYLECIKKKCDIPICSDKDERLHLLSDEYPEYDFDTIKAEEKLIGFLESRSKEQLIDVIVNLSRQYPEIAHDMATQHLISKKDPHGLEESIRDDIRAISQESGWNDPWQEDEFTPELDRVRIKLEALLKAGCPEKVLMLAEELCRESNEIIEMHDDEGETGIELAACMSVAFLALKSSQMDAVEKIFWVLDRVLEDEYGVCEPIEAYLFEDHDKAIWNRTADLIIDRLGMNGKKRQTDTDDAWYPRSLLVRWGVYALEQAGRKDEVLTLYRHDAKKSGNIRTLVKELIRLGQYDEAEKTLREEIKRKERKKSWEAVGLYSDLLELMVIKKNWLVASAISAERFIRQPSERRFIECRDLCENLGHWEKIRQYLILYLETAALPWKQKDWPLPPSGLSLPDPGNNKDFPKLSDLIDIAIIEKQPAQVLKWYDKLTRQGNRLIRVNLDQVAMSIKEYDPLRAVSLWKKIAEHHISLVKPKAYLNAAKVLKKAAKVMERQNKQAEWLSYLDLLKNTHKRKTKLMEVIDRLENNVIIEEHHKQT